MVKVKPVSKNRKKLQTPKKMYDFKDSDPKRVLTKNEVIHFDECMRLKNKSIPADQMNIEGAANSVITKMRRKYT